MRNTTPILTIILLIVSSFSVCGQSNYSPNQRVALVIGNSNYDAGPLLNPGNDARAMAEALRETNFEVLEYIDLASQADMKRAIREFGKKIQNGGVGLFYYAGHGIQVSGKNFLIPTKAQIYAEEEVEYESVDVGFVMSQMEIARNRMNIIILDACRNNPFARSWRSAATGLAFINAPTGTLIAYSTSPGSVASDGTGANGLYTEELLKQMRRKGLKLEDVFKSVRAEVLDKSSKQQTPWESSSLVGDFYFIKPDADITQTLAETETGITEPAETKPDAGESVKSEAYSSNKYADNTRSNEKLEWKREAENSYYIFRNGEDISLQTEAVQAGDDIIAFEKAANRTYLLKDYYNIQHNNVLTPIELFSQSNAFWKTDGDNSYWFYLEGQDLSQVTTTGAYGDDYLIYYEQDNRYYLMSGFKNAIPWEYYPANLVISYNNTLWCADDTYYYLYVKGEQMAARTWAHWVGNDLLVHDEETQSSYRLRDYNSFNDGKLRTAEIMYQPGLMKCTRDKGDLYNITKGTEVYYMPSPASYSDQDLLIYDTLFHQHLVFEDYLRTPKNTEITGRVIYSKNGAVWRSNKGYYYLYIKGILQTEGMVTGRYSLNDTDFEVTETENGNIWILEDYTNRSDNILRPAELKQ